MYIQVVFVNVIIPLVFITLFGIESMPKSGFFFQRPKIFEDLDLL